MGEPRNDRRDEWCRGVSSPARSSSPRRAASPFRRPPFLRTARAPPPAPRPRCARRFATLRFSAGSARGAAVSVNIERGASPRRLAEVAGRACAWRGYGCERPSVRAPKNVGPGARGRPTFVTGPADGTRRGARWRASRCRRSRRPVRLARGSSESVLSDASVDAFLRSPRKNAPGFSRKRPPQSVCKSVVTV
jgi:hypothetical protein